MKHTLNLSMIILSSLILVLDQVSKFYIKKNLAEENTIKILNDLFELRYSENTGIAFSFFNDNATMLTILNSAIILALIIWVINNHSLSPGLAFIIAGGLGNLIDRYIHGYVIDFINPLFIDFAVFNVADIALNIGVALLILDSFRKNDHS